MMMDKRLRWLAWVLILLVPSLTIAQALDKEVGGVHKRVAVLPFLSVRPAGGERVVKGLYGSYFFRTGELPARAGGEVTAIFFRQLGRLGRCALVPLDEAKRAVEDEPLGVDPLGVATKVGRGLGVDAVVIGGVYRYEERVGSPIGVQSPASAAFDAHLVDVAEGRIIWSGRFDETQHSLSENLFKIGSFVKGGAQWVTVERWTEIGIDAILRSFPDLKR